MIFPVLVANGRAVFSPQDEQKIKTFMRKNHGKTVYISFSERQPPRTLLQNNYLWGAVYETISNETGEDPEAIHEEMKNMFCPRLYEKLDDGTERMLPKSTTRLNTKEFTYFIERVRAYFASNYGISTPDPVASDL